MLSALKNNIHISLYFLAVLSIFLFTIPGFAFWWGWLSLSFLIIAFIITLKAKLEITPFFVAMLIYTLAMLFNIYFINPAFHPEGLYFLSFLFISYLFGRNLNNIEFIKLYKIVLIIFSILAVWGIFQYLTGMGYIVSMGNRANSIFVTPNSFAAVINLVLLPLIILRLYFTEERKLDIFILLLFSALLVTQSRGGWIAFSSGLSLGILTLMLIKRIKLNKANISLLAKALIIIAIFNVYHQSSYNQSLISRAKLDEVEDSIKFSSLNHRLIFYDIAWQRSLEKPLLGKGYFNFKYFLDRDISPEYRNQGTTHYVHNDYLQHLMETGVIGLFTILMLIACFYFQAWKCSKIVDAKIKIILIAFAACFTSYFVHALGDFVIYLPILTVFSGLGLGLFDRVCSHHISFKKLDYTTKFTKKYLLILRTVFVSLLISYFSTPLIAKELNKYADRQYESQNFQNALSYFQYASMLAPYEPNYLLDEAKLWGKAAREQHSADAANVADKLLKQCIEINPFEQNCLLERSRLHRDYQPLLNQNTDINTILNWQEEVLAWRPRSRAGQLEYVKSLYKAGRITEAKQRYAELQQQIINNPKLNSLLNRALKPDG